jgi:hypothetical protein
MPAAAVPRAGCLSTWPGTALGMYTHRFVPSTTTRSPAGVVEAHGEPVRARERELAGGRVGVPGGRVVQRLLERGAHRARAAHGGRGAVDGRRGHAVAVRHAALARCAPAAGASSAARRRARRVGARRATRKCVI